MCDHEWDNKLGLMSIHHTLQSQHFHLLKTFNLYLYHMCTEHRKNINGCVSKYDQ